MKSAAFLTDLRGFFTADGTPPLAQGYPVPIYAGEPVAQIDEAEYATLVLAAGDAKTGDTVTLLADTTEEIQVPESADFTLELNGKTLTGTVTSAGTLTIQDSVGGGGISAAGASSSAVHVTGGRLTVTGGSFTSKSNTIYNDGGTVWIGGDDTAITTTNLINGVCVYNDSGSTFITGGIFKGSPYAALTYAATAGDVQISGGTFSHQNISNGESESYLVEGYKVVAKGDGTYTVVPSYVASVTSGDAVTNYGTLQAAIDAAHDGDTITLLQDIPGVNSVILPAGVTLDLNGKGLQVSAVFVAFGDVIDSGDGEGGLFISSDTSSVAVVLQKDNRYLPIYDSEQGCYRLFSYQLKSFDPFTEGMENAVQLWFRLLFTNYDAYALLGEGSDSSQLQITLDLTWDGLGGTVSVLFTPDILEEMAAAAAEGKEMSKYGLYVQLTGLNKLPLGTEISGTPRVESTAGVVSTSDPITYTTATNT